MRKEELVKEFCRVFDYSNEEETRLFFAPGRFNLIGEHTDYNGGHVLPCAINRGIYAAAGKRNDDRVRLYSQQKEGVKEFSIGSILQRKFEGWVKYPLAVLSLLYERSGLNNGLDIYYSSTLPLDSGLSSSAAIEAVTGFAFDQLFDIHLPLQELARLCHRAENEIVGVRCGIMDQFAVILPRKNHALFLDCRSGNYEHIPLQLKDYSLVLVHSNTYRTLDSAAYNQKRSDCEKSLEILGPRLAVEYLCDITPEEYDRYEQLLPEALRPVARHPVYEEERVKKAVDCLARNDLKGLGRLLYDSHLSLKNDYRVTNDGLDTLFEEAQKIPGVAGARMTGAGFGGCTVNLVRSENLALFQEQLAEKYTKRMELVPAFYPVSPESGVCEIR